MLSIVVPVFNEEENVRPLADAVRAALRDGHGWELLFVDDGSTDHTAAAIDAAAAEDARIRAIVLARNYGQTAATRAGFDHARGTVIVTLDGDLQNDPRDIPRLVARLEEGYDLVAGYRQQRQDRLLTRRVPSRIANWLIGLMSGVRVRDNGCSLRAYRRELVERLALYADFHRLLPAVAEAAGARITELEVRHHPRRYGHSKYGLWRTWQVALDLLVLRLLRAIRQHPFPLFATGGFAALLASAGFWTGAVLTHRGPEDRFADAVVLPAAALLSLGLAGYLWMLGLIAAVALMVVRPRSVRGV